MNRPILIQKLPGMNLRVSIFPFISCLKIAIFFFFLFEFFFKCVTLTMCLLLCCCSPWYQWPYGDICGIGPVGKGQGTEFNLTFRKGSGKKSETLKFSTEHRTELLTEALVRSSCITSR